MKIHLEKGENPRIVVSYKGVNLGSVYVDESVVKEFKKKDRVELFNNESHNC